MIMRIWHGYDEMLRNEILPGIHRINGYLGAHLLRRDDGDEVEFVTITTWESWDAIAEFAGPSKTGSVIYPKAAALLSRHDEHSEHYEAVWVA